MVKEEINDEIGELIEFFIENDGVLKKEHLEYIKDKEFELKVEKTIESSKLEELEDNISKLGFIKVFKVKDDNWYLSKDTKFVLIIGENVEWGLYSNEYGV